MDDTLNVLEFYQLAEIGEQIEEETGYLNLRGRLERLGVHEDRRSALSYLEPGLQPSDSGKRQQRRNVAYSGSNWRRLHSRGNHPVTRNPPEGSSSI